MMWTGYNTFWLEILFGAIKMGHYISKEAIAWGFSQTTVENSGQMSGTHENCAHDAGKGSPVTQ